MVDIHDTSDARIDQSAVRSGGFETQLDDTALAEPIATAHSIVEEELLNEGLSDDRLARIEAYLARHIIRHMVEQVETSVSTGGTSVSYQTGETGLDLRATPHGQQALLLDTSNTLGRQSISIESING